jgi:hypothetical protein
VRERVRDCGLFQKIRRETTLLKPILVVMFIVSSRHLFFWLHLNLESGEGRAYTRKESSKGEIFKDIVQVVEQFQSSSNSLELSEKEKKTQKLLTFRKNQSRHPNERKEPKRLHRFKLPKRLKKPK